MASRFPFAKLQKTFENYPKRMADSQRPDIIRASCALFSKQGVRCVRMEDIALALGISKKTIYKHFTNKADLVKEASSLFTDHLEKEFGKLQNLGLDPINTLLCLPSLMATLCEHPSATSFAQMNIDYPELYQDWQDRNAEQVVGFIRQNITEGIATGLYHERVNIDLVSEIFLDGHRKLFDPSANHWADPEIKAKAASFVEHHLRAMCSQTGMIILNQHLNLTTNKKPNA